MLRGPAAASFKNLQFEQAYIFLSVLLLVAAGEAAVEAAAVTEAIILRYAIRSSYIFKNTLYLAA
jgi:hypothetical protein